MSADRLPLRLLDLPPAILAELAAKAFTRCHDVLAEAEAALAIHKPVPALVTEVLLTPDLLPFVMAVLPVASKSAALVCSAWCDAWQTTAPLRGLCPVELPQTDVAITCAAVVTSLSDERLCITLAHFQPVFPGGEPWRHIVVDSGMRKLYDLQVVQRRIAMATPNTLYAWNQDANMLWRYKVNDDGSVVELARNEEVRPGDNDTNIYSMTPAPGGIVLASVYGGDDEIIALDALSLEFGFQFGSEFLEDVRESVVVGDELFVGDRSMKYDDDGKEIAEMCYGRMQVFSLTGQYLREIRSTDNDWGSVDKLCCVSGRLYFTNRKHDGYCIVVLTPEGQRLQTFVPTVPCRFPVLCRFRNDLLLVSNEVDAADLIAVQCI